MTFGYIAGRHAAGTIGWKATARSVVHLTVLACRLLEAIGPRRAPATRPLAAPDQSYRHHAPTMPGKPSPSATPTAPQPRALSIPLEHLHAGLGIGQAIFTFWSQTAQCDGHIAWDDPDAARAVIRIEPDSRKPFKGVVPSESRPAPALSRAFRSDATSAGFNEMRCKPRPSDGCAIRSQPDKSSEAFMDGIPATHNSAMTRYSPASPIYLALSSIV